MDIVVFRRVRDAIATAALWFMVGFGTALFVAPKPPAPAPGPVVPAPTPPPVNGSPATAVHTGRITVSLIEPLYTTPATAAVRHDLAAYDWTPLDAMFRGYTDGQTELTSLGFTRCYVASDLPIVFFQETLAGGSAPLVPPPLKPLSAAVVIDRVKELRGK